MIPNENVALCSSVSVVVPLFNKKSTISRCINAILHQTHKPTEIIIVDDGSIDGGAEVAQVKLEGFIGGRVVRQSNLGVSSARNRGISESISDIVFLCDADDEWKENHIATVMNAVQRDDEFTVYSTMHSVIRGDRVASPSAVIGGSFISAYNSGSGVIHSSSVAVNKSKWSGRIEFPVGIKRGEDTFVWLTLGAKDEIRLINECTVKVHKDIEDGYRRRVGEIPYIYTRNEILRNPEYRDYLRRHSSRVLLMAEIDMQPHIVEKVRRIGVLSIWRGVFISLAGRFIRVTRSYYVFYYVFSRLKRLRAHRSN